MSNLYNLTKTLHTLAQQKAKKHGLELRIKGSFIWHYEHFPPSKNLTAPTGYFGKFYNDLEVGFTRSKDDFLAIEADQIRQILLVFKDVLGENPYFEHGYRIGADDFETFANGIAVGQSKESQAEALCQKWLNSLTPMFDSNPEKVLQELISVLESL